MKMTRPLQIALACGLSCGLVGCKTPTSGSSWSPTSWFSRHSSAQSTAPEVQYNGMSDGFSTTVKQNAQTQVVSGVKPEGTMTKAWKSTTGAVASTFGATPKTGKDATSLSSRPGKLDADLYIRAARFAEQGDNLTDAEAKYQQALKVEPKNVTAIIGLARLYDKQENSQAAVATYKQAIKLHPTTALVYNDLGLCYGRRRELGPAHQMLQKAVELEPGKANYRNNLAAVLVDMGRPQEAYQQLAAVQAEGVAHYNLAFLLHSRGQQGPAIAHLQQAIAKDATLTPARELLAQLEGGGSLESIPQPGVPSQPNMTMVSNTRTARAPAGPAGRTRPSNQRQQMHPEDLQPPEVSYGPAGNGAGNEGANEAGAYRLQSYVEEVHVEEAESTSGPATLRITDDEE